jgi:hypothetical protein
MPSDKPEAGEITQLCYVVGELSGKVDLLVGKISETMTSLVTERTRIDGIDRRLAAFSIIGPILAVVVPSAISIVLALMMRPPVDRGLTGEEVMQLRDELQLLQELKRTKGRDAHFSDRMPERLP